MNTKKNDIEIYTKDPCPYCVHAKRFFQDRQLPFEEIRIDLDSEQREIMMHRSGRHTVPQIFINGVSVGGYDDLMERVRNKTFETLLK